MKNLPLVSIIIPTTMERREFNISILQQARKQDYPNKEILFDYSDNNVGKKRNKLCEIAQGEIICSFDSDDHYSPDWVSKSVEFLLKSECDITGLRSYFNYVVDTKKVILFIYKPATPLWIAGATMCYWRKTWERNPFKEYQIGEDGSFLWDANPQLSIYPHPYIEGFLATLHNGNSSPKDMSSKDCWKGVVDKCATEIKSDFGITQ